MGPCRERDCFCQWTISQSCCRKKGEQSQKVYLLFWSWAKIVIIDIGDMERRWLAVRRSTVYSLLLRSKNVICGRPWVADRGQVA